jgi:hypothetical protein
LQEKKKRLPSIDSKHLDADDEVNDIVQRKIAVNSVEQIMSEKKQQFRVETDSHKPSL